MEGGEESTETIKQYLHSVKRNRIKRRRLTAFLIALSLMISVGVAWSLHLTGETISKKTYCGLEEHSHSEECIKKVLICGFDTEESEEKVCEPASAHVHTNECYETKTVLACKETEHKHSVENGCYDEEGNLTCGIPEHLHGEEAGCYITEQVLTCGLEEGVTESTEIETETAAHVHTDECYEITYLCGYDLTDETILGYGTLSLVYGTAAQADSYVELDPSVSVTQVDSFLLWIHDATSGGAIVVNRGSDNPITDALTYTDTDSSVYYLVPLTYFTDVQDQLEYFTFDKNNCPFLYAPNAYSPTADLTDTVYVIYGENWYVRVRDTSNAGTPRSNIYYDVTKEVGDYFTLTYNGVELKVHVVDIGGKPIYGNYDQYSMTLNAATKYLFEANASDTTSTMINIPTIEDYSYSGTHIQAYNGVSVVSVATSGYPLDTGNGTLGKNFRFYESGGTDSNGKYYTKDSGTVYLVYEPEMHPVTEVASANSTAVNLFDYWLTTRDASDYHQNGDDLGINIGHTLKFHSSSSDAVGTLNKWTGSGGGVLQGIVQQSLADGYPALSGNTALGMTDSVAGESLNYLFDPSVTSEYKASYRNVQGLFQVNSNGYCYYDARENFAEFDAETNRFNLYEETGVANGDTTGTGMFFPFNTIDETYPLSSGESSVLNHYFGLSLTTRFIQNYDGHTDATRTTPNTFQFAGDDDVWIFIDDVLVADLGGIHDAVGVTIDFAEGKVVINNVYDGQAGVYPVTTYFSDIFKNTGVNLATYSVTDENGETAVYTTFANNTTHTLKFYYLERGNVDSNLYLRYNLTDIPDTSLYKIDQYGNSVAGAAFATYPYDSTEDMETSDFDKYGYITDKGSVVSLKYLTEEESPADLTEDHYYVDPVTGIITVNKEGTLYTITPAYVGVTDGNGEMTFLDPDGMAYSQAELKGMFGEYFILREIKTPDGYRTVSDDAILYFQDELLQCYDPYSTGVWANPNALITASNTLYIADNYGNSSVGDNDTGIPYYNPSTGESKGTLFAIVLKRNQDTGTQIKPDTFTGWLPVYGDDDTGYHTVPFGTDGAYGTQLEAVLAAAKLSDKLSNVEFAYSTDGMQVLFENLPGAATRYYSYMVNHNDEFTTTDPQYLIAYYYTTADSLDGADADNTVRIRSHGGTATDGTVYNAFNVQWGATVEIPNVINALYFQKADEHGVLLDNAVFALYEAATDSNGKGYYVGTDAEGGAVYIRLDETNGNGKNGKATVYTSLPESADSGIAGTYTVSTDFGIPTQESGGTGYITDSGAGVITVTAGGSSYTVTPALNVQGQSLVGYTHDVCRASSEKGTGHFMYIETGNYFMKEIACPAGYDVNRVNIPVEVTGEGVYANAGAVDNNVRVGNGVGYLVKTMDIFASPSEIDETLCWVYTRLKVESSLTADFLSDLDDTFYTHSGFFDYLFDGFGSSSGKSTVYIPEGALTDGSGEGALTDGSENKTNAMTQYMRYDGSLTETTDDNKIFDYALYEGTDGNVRGVQSYRLWTESGWSDLAIYQDYDYGSAQITTNAGDNTAQATTAYTDLTGYGEISYLFSSSTFVQVTDQYSYGDLEISKTVLPDTEEAFTFTLTLTDENAKNIIPLTGTYPYTVYDVTVADDGTETRTVAQTTDADGKEVEYTGTLTVASDENSIQTGSLNVTLKNGQVLVIEDLPYGAAYTVTETLPTGNNLPYTTWVSVNGGAKTEELTDSGTLIWRADVDDVDTNVYNVDYNNALLPLVKIIKVDSMDKAALAGAKFVMYRIRADGDKTVKEYYSDGRWLVLEDGKSEEDYAVTTDETGELLFANMDADGTYYLKELAPPDGYRVLAEPIEFTVANGVIVSPTKESISSVYEVTDILYEGQLLNMMVYNFSGFELPKTGGAGTVLYTAGGLVLILAAGAGFTCRRRKRIRDRRQK